MTLLRIAAVLFLVNIAVLLYPSGDKTAVLGERPTVSQDLSAESIILLAEVDSDTASADAGNEPVYGALDGADTLTDLATPSESTLRTDAGAAVPQAAAEPEVIATLETNAKVERQSETAAEENLDEEMPLQRAAPVEIGDEAVAAEMQATPSIAIAGVNARMQADDDIVAAPETDGADDDNLDADPEGVAGKAAEAAAFRVPTSTKDRAQSADGDDDTLAMADSLPPMLEIKATSLISSVDEGPPRVDNKRRNATDWMFSGWRPDLAGWRRSDLTIPEARGDSPPSGAAPYPAFNSFVITDGGTLPIAAVTPEAEPEAEPAGFQVIATANAASNVNEPKPRPGSASGPEATASGEDADTIVPMRINAITVPRSYLDMPPLTADQPAVSTRLAADAVAPSPIAQTPEQSSAETLAADQPQAEPASDAPSEIELPTPNLIANVVSKNWLTAYRNTRVAGNEPAADSSAALRKTSTEKAQVRQATTAGKAIKAARVQDAARDERFCLRVGPFFESTTFASATGELEARSLSFKSRSVKPRQISAVRVFAGPFQEDETLEAFRERLSELKVRDSYLMARNSEGVVVSLGLYSAQETADEMIAMLAENQLTVQSRREERKLSATQWVEIGDRGVSKAERDALIGFDWGDHRARVREISCRRLEN